MLTVDIALPDVEELQKLVADGQEKGFLTYDEIVAGLEEVELSKEQLARLDAVSQVPKVFPMDVLKSPAGGMMFGNVKVTER